MRLEQWDRIKRRGNRQQLGGGERGRSAIDPDMPWDWVFTEAEGSTISGASNLRSQQF